MNYERRNRRQRLSRFASGESDIIIDRDLHHLGDEAFIILGNGRGKIDRQFLLAEKALEKHPNNEKMRTEMGKALLSRAVRAGDVEAIRRLKRAPFNLKITPDMSVRYPTGELVYDFGTTVTLKECIKRAGNNPDVIAEVMSAPSTLRDQAQLVRIDEPSNTQLRQQNQH